MEIDLRLMIEEEMPNTLPELVEYETVLTFGKCRTLFKN